VIDISSADFHTNLIARLVELYVILINALKQPSLARFDTGARGLLVVSALVRKVAKATAHWLRSSFSQTNATSQEPKVAFR
jgi:hypothetical protein